MTEEQEIVEGLTKLDNNVAMLTILLGVTAGAIDRPARVGVPPMTWTEALLLSIDRAKKEGLDVPIFNLLRSALEIGSEPPPTDSDGGSRIAELVRKAA